MQLCLWDSEPMAEGLLDKIYFCLRPPEDVRDRIWATCLQTRTTHGLRRKPRPPETYHVSLIALGGLKRLRPADLEAATHAAATIRWPPMDLSFSRLQSWHRTDGKATFVLLGTQETDAAIRRLAKKIGHTMVMSGIRCGEPPAQPHLTMAYDPTMVPETMLAEPIHFAANDFVLVRNHHGESQLDDLRRYRLA